MKNWTSAHLGYKNNISFDDSENCPRHQKFHWYVLHKMLCHDSNTKAFDAHSMMRLRAV